MNRNTLVIEGAGLIGGRNVTVVGRSVDPRYALPGNAAYVSGDFAQLHLLRTLLDRHDEVIHLAYATVPNTSYDNPLGDLLENLPATVQLFSEVAGRGSRLVLISSGGTVYGEAATLPITEQHPTNPISPYGVTKLTLEKYARLYSVTRGLDVVCVRPANAYGEGQRPFTGQGFIATAMASMMRSESVKIFGEHGTVRDYIHIDDIAKGIISALDFGKKGETYNLGTGLGFSNLEVVEAIAPLLKEFGCNVQTIHDAERPFDVRSNVLDSSKLQALTGWCPSISFEEGLLRTRDWLRNYAI
jgi:UDP-glucose 4-epimerase